MTAYSLYCYSDKCRGRTPSRNYKIMRSDLPSRTFLGGETAGAGLLESLSSVTDLTLAAALTLQSQCYLSSLSLYRRLALYRMSSQELHARYPIAHSLVYNYNGQRAKHGSQSKRLRHFEQVISRPKLLALQTCLWDP